VRLLAQYGAPYRLILGLNEVTPLALVLAVLECEERVHLVDSEPGAEPKVPDDGGHQRPSRD
jgi:hypothetical protein